MGVARTDKVRGAPANSIMRGETQKSPLTEQSEESELHGLFRFATGLTNGYQAERTNGHQAEHI